MSDYEYREIHGEFNYAFYRRGDSVSFDPAIREWCFAHFGDGVRLDTHLPRGQRWAYTYRGDVGFRQKNDAFAFRMRWC